MADYSPEDLELADHIKPGSANENTLMLFLLALCDEHGDGGELRLPPGWRAKIEGMALAEKETDDGGRVFQAIVIPPLPKVQAILDGGADWLEAQTGKALKVTGASQDGCRVVFVREDGPGRWGEPLEYHPDCFLRDAVLAGGVPLL